MTREDSEESPNIWQRAWRRMFNAEDFYSSIKLLIGLSLALGITPYHISRDGQHGTYVVHETCFGFANAISRWFMFAYCYTHTTFHNESLIGYFMSNHVSQMSTRLHVVAGIIAALVIFITPLFLRRYLRNTLANLVRIDVRLTRLACPINYKQVQYLSWRVLLKVSALDGVIITICLVCLAKMEVQASWQLIFIMIYELITISVTICMFCLLALSVRRRMKRLHTVSEKDYY